MGGEIQPPALKIVSHMLENQSAKGHLVVRVEGLREETLVGLDGRLADLIQKMNQGGPESRKKRTEVGDGGAGFKGIQKRVIGRIGIAKVIGFTEFQADQFLEFRQKELKVIGFPGLNPHLLG